MAKNIIIFRLVEVISVDDENDLGRIKVRFKPEDDDLTDDKLPFAIPLLPKVFHIIPKKGEMVLASSIDVTNGDTQRRYIGPVISDKKNINFEPYGLYSKIMFDGSRLSPDVAESNKPDTTGVYPEKEDVAVLGRRYSDIFLTENDVRLRAGVKLPSEGNANEIEFNKKNPAFIKLNYNPEEQTADNKNFNSTVSVVADNILLLGNTPKDGTNVEIDRKELLSDEKIKELIEKSHELPYGDKLVEFLIMFRDAFINHTHPFPTFIPCQTEEIINLKNYNLTTILSNCIRIN